jgi:hypothetical protein
MRMFQITRRVAVGLALVGCAVASASASTGCGDDTGSGGTTATSGPGSTATTGTTTATTTTGTAGGGGAGGAGECECGDMCMGMGTPECPIDAADPVEVCVADVCETEAMACCAIDGCLDLVQCVRESGCESLECYLVDGMDGPCKAEIDALGGVASAGVGAAQTLGDCAVPKCGGCT